MAMRKVFRVCIHSTTDCPSVDICIICMRYVRNGTDYRSYLVLSVIVLSATS